MEGHSGQKCNWIVTSIPLDRTACYSFASCMPFDRTRLSIVPSIRSCSTFGRTSHSVVLPIRSYRAFGRTPHSIVPSIRSYSPFDRTEHSVVLPIRPRVSFGQRFNKKTAASSMGYTQMLIREVNFEFPSFAVVVACFN